MTVHAPHPGYKFLAWRAWTMGMDRDYQAFQTATRSRLGRLGFAFKFFGGKVGKVLVAHLDPRQECRSAGLAATRRDGDHPRLLWCWSCRRTWKRPHSQFRTAAQAREGRCAKAAGERPQAGRGLTRPLGQISSGRFPADHGPLEEKLVRFSHLSIGAGKPRRVAFAGPARPPLPLCSPPPVLRWPAVDRSASSGSIFSPPRAARVFGVVTTGI